MKKFLIVSLTLGLSIGVFATDWSPYNYPASFFSSQILGKGNIFYDSTANVIRMGDGTTVGGLVLSSTIPSGSILANQLQAAATNLGAANVTVNLANSNGAFVTNLSTNGSITASNKFIGGLTGNADTVTTNANLTGVVTSTGNATAIAGGAIKANMLQDTAYDLGASNITVNLGNSNGAFVTNLTTNGLVTASHGFSGNLTGNADTATNGMTSVDTAITVDTGATSAGYINITVNGNPYKMMVAAPSI